MKKIGLIFLFALLIMMVVSCGGNSTTDNLTTLEPTTVEPTTSPTTVTPTTQIPVEGDLANGLYEYEFIMNPLRDVFYDVKAEYALNNLVMGVPIYRDSLEILKFSDRVDLPLETYDEFLNYNEFESKLTENDLGITLLDGSTGKADEYTFRVSTDMLDNDWNHLSSNNREALLTRYNEAPYKWVQTVDGKELISNYFVSDPLMKEINPEPSLSLEAKVFEFTLKDNLVWQYHPLTDTSSFPEGHEIIDASDFVYSYKYALRRYFTASYALRALGVLYADEYHDNISYYEDLVGIEVVDDLTFRLTFSEYRSLDLVKEKLTDSHMAPLNSVMHLELGELYGDDIYSIAYSGNFYIDEATANYLRLIPNPNNLNPNNHFTAIEFKYEYLDENLIADFNLGLYDMINLTTFSIPGETELSGYKLVPKDNFKSIAINGSLIAKDQGIYSQAINNEYEPILSSEIFQKALYYAINREEITETIVDYKIPLADYFDSETPFFGDFHRSSFGYAPGLTLTYFHLALEELSDIYQDGDIITLTLAYDDEDEALAHYLENSLEDQFNDRERDITIDIVLVNIYDNFLDVLSDYYPYLQYYYPDQQFIDSVIGNYDLYITDIYFDTSFWYQNPLYNGQLNDLNGEYLNVDYTLKEYDEQGNVTEEIEVNELWTFMALQEMFNTKPAIIEDGKAMEETAAELVETTPFGFKLLLPEFSSDKFESIEFEVYGLSYNLGEYVSIYERQVLTTDEIIVLEDQGYFYYLNFWFELKYYPGIVKEVEMVVFLPLLVEEIDVSGTTATIYLSEIDKERNFLIDSVEVYYRNGGVVSCEVAYLGNQVTITGLEADKEYVMKFLTDDSYSIMAEEDFIFKARFLT